MANKYTKVTCKCNICGDVFVVDSEEYVECSCNKNSVRVTGNGWITYHNSGKYGNNFEIIREESYLISNSFCRLTESEEDRLDKLDRKMKKLEGYKRLYLDVDEHGKECIPFISGIRVHIGGLPIQYTDKIHLSYAEFGFSVYITDCNTLEDLEIVRRKIRALERIVDYSIRKFDRNIEKAIVHLFKRNKNIFDRYFEDRTVTDMYLGI